MDIISLALPEGGITAALLALSNDDLAPPNLPNGAIIAVVPVDLPKPVIALPMRPADEDKLTIGELCTMLFNLLYSKITQDGIEREGQCLAIISATISMFPQIHAQLVQRPDVFKPASIAKITKRLFPNPEASDLNPRSEPVALIAYATLGMCCFNKDSSAENYPQWFTRRCSTLFNALGVKGSTIVPPSLDAVTLYSLAFSYHDDIVRYAVHTGCHMKASSNASAAHIGTQIDLINKGSRMSNIAFVIEFIFHCKKALRLYPLLRPEITRFLSNLAIVRKKMTQTRLVDSFWYMRALHAKAATLLEANQYPNLFTAALFWKKFTMHNDDPMRNFNHNFRNVKIREEEMQLMLAGAKVDFAEVINDEQRIELTNLGYTADIITIMSNELTRVAELIIDI